MRVTTRQNLCVTLLCTASVVALSSAARAQDAAAPAETVVVTGSRVISDVANSPTPITAISTAQLAATSPVDIPDALNKLPIFLGSNTPADTGNAGNGGTGNTLNLRDFGAQRTLVLFDGHRQPPSNSDGTVDIDTLPQMLMKRVDIVTGGASAVYGSDAVTGVVNFVIDNHFNGIKVNTSAGITTYADGATQQFNIAAGTDLFGGRGHLEGSFRYFHMDPILLNARKWGADINGNGAWASEGLGTAANPMTAVPNAHLVSFAYGGRIACTGCAANGQQFVSNGVLGPFQLGTPSASSNVYTGGDGVANQSAGLQVGQITYQDFERFSYNITDSITGYIQVIAAQSLTRTHKAPTYFQTGTYPNMFFSNNPFLTPTAQAALANTSGKFTDTQYLDYRYYPEVNERHNLNRNLGIATGLDGTIFEKFDWDLYYSHSENRLMNHNTHDENDVRMAAANDAVVNPANGQIVCQVSLTAYASLYPGCVPLNRFGPTAATESALNYIFQDSVAQTTQVLDDYSGSISGSIFDLPAGPIKAALNGEYRRATYEVVANGVPGTVDCATAGNGLGLRLCVTGAPQTQHQATLSQGQVSQSVWEFAGEVNAPLLKDMPLVQSLDLDLAGRYTNYSIAGAVETWKIGLDYHVNDTVHFRATTSIDIRAPTLADLYSPVTISHAGFTDIHTGNQVQQATDIAQGNPNLVPEVARTYTGGVVLTPSFVPGLTVSMDYYQIVLKNAITNPPLSGSTAGVQQICEASGGNSPLCALFVRPLPFSNTSAANYPTAVLSETLNAALNDTSGVDMEVDYGFQLGDVWDAAPGSIDLRSFLDYQPNNNSASFPNAPITEKPVPKGRVTSIVTYTLGNWEFDVTDRWYSKFNRSSQPGILFYDVKYGQAMNYIDLNIDKKFVVDDNALDVYFNIKNLINEPPPLEPVNGTAIGGSAFGENQNPSIAGIDDVGRVFTIGLRASL